MRTTILRTVSIVILSVMGTRHSSGQKTTSGDRFFNFSIYRANDDPGGVATVVCKGGDSLYVLQFEGDKVLNFTVDGRAIPADSLGQYQSLIADIKAQFKKAEEQTKRDRAQAELDRQQAELDRQQAERDRRQAELERKEAEKGREQAERDNAQSERDRMQADKDREQAERDHQRADSDRQQAERDRMQADKDREQAERDRARAEEDRRMMDSLVTDLVADGIVSDRESVHSIKLDEDEVIVNGKQLPGALEKKYIAKYVKKGFSMSFHND